MYLLGLLDAMDSDDSDDFEGYLDDSMRSSTVVQDGTLIFRCIVGQDISKYTCNSTLTIDTDKATTTDRNATNLWPTLIFNSPGPPIPGATVAQQYVSLLASSPPDTALPRFAENSEVVPEMANNMKQGV